MISRFYRNTLKRIPGLDQSRIMQPVKRIYRHFYYPTPETAERKQVQHMPQNRGAPEPGLDSTRLEMLGWFISKLELPVSPPQLLSEFEKQMNLHEWQNLAALLDWGIQNSEVNRKLPPRGSVSRMTDFKQVEIPERRRNILFVTGQFPNPMHGGGSRVFDFIKVMSKAHNVYLYTWFVEKEDALALETLKPYCQAVDSVPFLEFENSLERLKRFVANVPIDIVHYEWPRSLTNFDCSLAKFNIFTYMECTSLRLLIDMRLETLLTPDWVRKAISLFGALKVELVDAAKANARVVVTRKDGEFLARFTPQDTYLIVNHGINLDEFCLPDQEPEDHSLVFVGNFQHYPNEDAVRFFFTQVFDLIKARVPDVHVHLVGANPSQTVQAYQDSHNVFVTGTVDDIRPYIQRASVCIAPLVTGAGLRSKVIQFAALNRVCVATSISAMDLLFEDGKDIFIADDPVIFAERVVYLLQHPETARRMSKSAFEKACFHYDNRKFVQDLYRVYSHLEAASQSSQQTTML